MAITPATSHQASISSLQKKDIRFCTMCPQKVEKAAQASFSCSTCHAITCGRQCLSFHKSKHKVLISIGSKSRKPTPNIKPESVGLEVVLVTPKIKTASVRKSYVTSKCAICERKVERIAFELLCSKCNNINFCGRSCLLIHKSAHARAQRKVIIAISASTKKNFLFEKAECKQETQSNFAKGSKKGYFCLSQHYEPWDHLFQTKHGLTEATRLIGITSESEKEDPHLSISYRLNFFNFLNPWEKILQNNPSPFLRALVAKRIPCNLNEVSKITSFIETHRQGWGEAAQKTGKPLFFHSKENFLPRSIQYNIDGTIFIHFDETHRGDPLIGRGAFKTVTLACNYSTGTWKASQNIPSESSAKLEYHGFNLTREIQGLLKAYYEVKYNKTTTIEENETIEDFKTKIITPLANENLLSYRYEMGKSLKQREAFAFDIISIVSNMHLQGIAHRDIKLDNILNFDGHAVLGDMGSVINIDSYKLLGKSFRKFPTTNFYCSPEYVLGLYKESAFDYLQLDIWSLGCVLHELFIGRLPWTKTVKNDEVFPKILALKHDWLNKPTEQTSLEHLAWEMLQIDPGKRLPSEKLMIRLFEIFPEGRP